MNCDNTMQKRESTILHTRWCVTVELLGSSLQALIVLLIYYFMECGGSAVIVWRLMLSQ